MTDERPIIESGPSPDDESLDEEPIREEPSFDVDDSLPLAAPTMRTRGFLIVCAVVGALSILVVREVSPEMPLNAWLIPLGIVAAVVAIRKLMIPSSARSIEFGPDAVELPHGRNSRRTSTVAYGDLRTIVPLVSRGQPALVIDGPGRIFIFVASDFPHPELWRVLWAQLLDRISQQPGAAAQLQKMRALAESSQETSSVSPRFTKYLFYVIAAIFGAQYFLAAQVAPPVDILESLYFGANSRFMVLQEGQAWRVVTANLLHGGGVHFAVNAFALYFLGTYSERLFGETRTVVLTLGTAVLGAAASLIGLGALPSLGLSTAIFGLLGAYFALHLRFGKDLPPPYRQTRRWWIFILGLNFVLSVAVPFIDAWGHFGGFFAGLAIAWLMTIGQKSFEPRPPSGRVLSIVATALIGLFVACSIIAINYAVGDHPDDEVAMAQGVLDHADDAPPVVMAQLSYNWTEISPRPDGLDPILMKISETAIRQSDDPYAHQRAGAAMIELYDEIGTQRVADSPFESAEFVDEKVALNPPGPLDEPRRVYLLARFTLTDFVLYRCLPAGDEPGEATYVETGPSPQARLQIAMVTPSPSCTTPESDAWKVIPVPNSLLSE